jgi:hypothetical protein
MNKMTIVTSAALFVVGIAATHLWQELRDEREQNNLLQTRVIDLEASLAATRFAALQAPPTADTANAVEAADGAKVEPPTATAATQARPARAAIVGMIQQTLNSPEGRSVLGSMARAALPRQYPNLGKELGLTPFYVEDAVAWAKQLRSDRRFFSVTILGHSEGSLIGILATQRRAADALVSVAGPARSAGQLLRAQLEALNEQESRFVHSVPRTAAQ